MKPKPEEKSKRAANHPTQHHWDAMNRKQRREMTRKIQSEDLRLEVLHPDAAGIDIGNESHYVSVPPSRPCRRSWTRFAIDSGMHNLTKKGDTLIIRGFASAEFSTGSPNHGRGS